LALPTNQRACCHASGLSSAEASSTTSLEVRAAAEAQVFVEDPGAPELSPSDAHHLLRVLRVRPGERVIAADGKGSWCECVFEGGSEPHSKNFLKACGTVQFEPVGVPPITVAFAPAKGDRPEWVVQKLTELGVDRVILLVADHSVVRWEAERVLRSLERLRKVVSEAACQSRRVWLPEVEAPVTLDELASLAGSPETTQPQACLAHPGGKPPSLSRAFLAVGPEGGWSERELGLGFPTVSLGEHVLRAETATVAAGALLGALRSGTLAEVGP